MKRLNNKGMTIIEVLISFVLIMMITASMYSSVSSFNQKRMIEEYKEQILTYKNVLTKEIQDDFIKIGLAHANYDRTITGDMITHTLNCDLKDGTQRQLIVSQRLAYSTYHIAGSHTSDDYFMIQYGKPTDLIEYDIPDLGSSKNEYNHVVKDLSINNVLIDITEDNVLSIYIGFYHPELTTRYAIEIIAPINFIFSGAEFIDPTREIYLISYDLRGGQIPSGLSNPNMYMLNTPTFTLSNPTKAAATFLGWTGSNGGVPQMNVSVPTGSSGHKSFTANWNDFKCNITYDPNGGNFSKNATNTTQECDYGYGDDGACTLRSATSNGFYKATREGYEICASHPWVAGGSAYAATAYPTASICPGILSGSQNVTLRANWAQKFNITYNYDGAADVKNPSSYNTCSSPITLKNPKKEGFEFVGWVGSNGTTPQKNVVIPTGTTGNLSYRAVWTEKTVTVTVYAASNDRITFTGPVTGMIQASTTGTAVVNLPLGYYTFTSSIAKKTDLNTAYTKNFQVKEEAQVLLFFPAGAIYWYGNGAVSGSYLYDKMGGIEYEYLDDDGVKTGSISEIKKEKEWIQVNPNDIRATMTTENKNYYSQITTKKSFTREEYNHLRCHVSATENWTNTTDDTFMKSSLYITGSSLKKEAFGKGKDQYYNIDITDSSPTAKLKFRIKSEANGSDTVETVIHAIWLVKE